jgi:hypothetical protein
VRSSASGSVSALRQIPTHELEVRLLVDALSAFGLFAVTAMMVCYAFESKSRWFILGFALSCGLGSIYGFLQGAWPFGIVEAIWMLVALRRWARRA